MTRPAGMVTALALAAGLLGAGGAWAETVRLGGTGSVTELLRLLGGAFERTRPDATVQVVPGLGSRGAKRALAVGRVDVAVSADPLTPAEAERATGGEWLRTALVLAAAASAPAALLTSQDLVEIYRGTRTTWPDGRRLRLVLRPAGDSDNTVLRGMSPAMHGAVDEALARPGMIVAATDQDAAEQVAAVPGALGTTTLALILSERRPLQALPLDGVTPSLASVGDGSYRHVKVVSLLIRADATPAARAFAEFARSPATAAIAASRGWVPAGPVPGR